jgi:hypothetical protein
MKTNKTKAWIPEIVYEETEQGKTSQIPFIHVPDDQIDPPLLFIFLTRQTGETEPGPDGEEMPIVDMQLHQYADMQFLRDNLSADDYDKVRTALGLEPRAIAAEKGAKITENVRSKLEK